MVTVRLAEKILADVPSSRRFSIHNGAEIKNLRELSDALKLMPNNSFRFHVSHDRNEFAEWVRDEINDWNLADSMEKAESKREMADKIRQREEYLTRAIGEQSIAHDYFMHSGIKEFIIGITVGFVVGVMFSIAL